MGRLGLGMEFTYEDYRHEGNSKATDKVDNKPMPTQPTRQVSE